MTIAARGREDMQRYLAQLPGQIEKVLRGAARAGASVVAEEAKRLSRSPYVSERVIVTPAKVEAERAYATVTVKVGWGRSLAIWLEYGTAAHIIRVADDRDRQGRSVGRINRQGGTLAINGQPVGKVVHHPGADSHPFLRPALDTMRVQAVTAAQAFIDARISRGVIVAGAGDEAGE